MPNNKVRQFALGSASAIALAVGFTAAAATPAAAQTEIYAGGATLPAVVYRQIFNCYSTDLSPTTTNTKTVDVNNLFDAPGCTAPQNRALRFGYAPVGSGAGQRAFIFDDPTRIGIPSTTTNTVPYSGNSVAPAPVTNSPALAGTGFLPFSITAPTGYPNHHWSGSDAIIPQTATPASTISYDCYNGNVATDASCTVDRRTVAGAAIQVPTLTTTVNIPFRLPGRNTLRLSERSLCGIFTGTITNWNDPLITADNGGSVTGGVARQILVAVRSDGSGTTFLFAQHLAAVCDGTRGALWTGGTGTSVTWPNAFFYKRSGNEGVAQAVAEENYFIGYTTPELTQPAVTTITVPTTVVATDGAGLNPRTITAGTYTARPRASLANKTGAYILPTAASGTAALASAVPPAGAAALDPAAWGIAGAVPDPTGATAYPIAGFTWYNGYTCYTSTAVGQGLRNFWNWYTTGTNTQLTTILTGKTFGRLPNNWQTAVRNLVVTGATTRIAGVGEPVATGNSTCTGKAGA